MVEFDDTSILDKFVQGELKHPGPRKFVGDRIIYASRTVDLPKRFGKVVISDSGQAQHGRGSRYHNAQPRVYKAPEVMLKVDWTYPADIWNVGKR